MSHPKKGQIKLKPKEYLSQIGILDIKINQKMKELDELRLLVTSTGSFDYSKEYVKTSGTGDNVEKKVINYVALEENINKMIKKYIELKHKIINEIQGLDEATHIDILFKKYVENKRLELIAVEMKYSYSRVKHLHGEALQAFGHKYLKVNTK